MSDASFAGPSENRAIDQEDQSRPAAAQHVIVLEAGQADREYWLDLWRYRELFAILAWRDIAVRYKQAALGVAWAVVRPLLTMIVFTVIFGRLANLPTDGTAPYAIMVFAGMLPWFLFSSILNDASASVVQNGRLISKIYFPRLVVPVSAAVVSLVDLAINIVLLLLLMAAFGFAPSSRFLLLPLVVLLAVLAAIGPALMLSAYTVKYRDFKIIVPFIVQFGLYVSPVGFSSAVVPESWRLLYSINPMVGVIDGFRWCVLGQDSTIYLPGFILSLVGAAFFLWLGLRVFRRTEKTFADLV